MRMSCTLSHRASTGDSMMPVVIDRGGSGAEDSHGMTDRRFVDQRFDGEPGRHALFADHDGLCGQAEGEARIRRPHDRRDVHTGTSPSEERM